MNPNLQISVIKDFGGINTEDSPWSMPPGDSPDALNVYTHRGNIRKRPAMKRRYTTQLPAAVSGTTVEGENYSQQAFIWQVNAPATYSAVYNETFESRALGNINGVDSWVDGAESVSPLKVENTTVPSGTKAIQYDDTASSNWYRRVVDGNKYTDYRLTFSIMRPGGAATNNPTYSFDLWSADNVNSGDNTNTAIRIQSDENGDIRVADASGVTVVVSQLSGAVKHVFVLTVKSDNSYILTLDGSQIKTGNVVAANRLVDRIAVKKLGGITNARVATDDIRFEKFYNSVSGTKLIVVQGGFSGTPSTAPRLVYTDAGLPGGSWTVLGDIAANGETSVFAVPFRDAYIFPAVPAATAKELSANLVIANLGVAPAAGAVAMNPMPDCVGFNRMLFACNLNGLVQFSYVDDQESSLASDTLTLGSTLWTPSALWDLGRFCLAVTESGVHAISGFGRSSNRSDRLNATVGAGDFHCIAGDDQQAFFPGHSSSRRLINQPGQNPYSGIYRVTPDGLVVNIAEDISSSSLFNNTYIWTGRRAEVALSYDTAWDFLYALAPRHFPLDAASSSGTGKECWVYHDGHWAKWQFPDNMHIAYIYPHGLKTATASPVADYSSETLLGGSGVNGYRYVYNFDMGYRSQASAVAAKDVDGNGAQANNITAYWTTPIYTISPPGTTDAVDAIYLFGNQTGGVLGHTVEYKVDNEANWQAAGAGLTILLKREGTRIPITRRGRTIQFKFTFAVDSIEPEINGFTIEYRPLARSNVPQ